MGRSKRYSAVVLTALLSLAGSGAATMAAGNETNTGAPNTSTTPALQTAHSANQAVIPGTINTAGPIEPTEASRDTTASIPVTGSVPAAPLMTFTGKAAGVDLITKTFWITSPEGVYPVAADTASFTYNNDVANINRLMGTPDVSVTGSMSRGEIVATSIQVTSAPTAVLEQSSYTDGAHPPFASGTLAIYWGASANQVASANSDEGGQVYSGQQAYAAPLNSMSTVRPSHHARVSRRHRSLRHHHS